MSLPRSGGGAVLSLSLIVLSPTARAQVAALPEPQLKAEFIERFTRFVDWPDDASESERPFVIGVVGQSALTPFLEQMAGSRRIKGRPVVVQPLQEPESMRRCHVVFIAASQGGSLPRILARVAHEPVLTISDSEGFAERGVIINFFELGDRLRFEINEPAAQRSGLRIGSQLFRLARVIRAEARR
jgi:hypothetical protein